MPIVSEQSLRTKVVPTLPDSGKRFVREILGLDQRARVDVGLTNQAGACHPEELIEFLLRVCRNHPFPIPLQAWSQE
jgi:hypothetical protein